MHKPSSALKSLLGLAGSAILVAAPLAATADDKPNTSGTSGKVQVKQQDVRKQGDPAKKGGDRAMTKTEKGLTKANKQLTKAK